MQFELQTSSRQIDAFLRSGLWPNRLITEYFDDTLATAPDRTAVIGYDSQTGTRTELSHASLNRAVERIALGLIEIGIEPGDVVSAQLPNYWQFTALYLACVRIGAVMNPLMPIFRRRELSFMLPFAEAKAVFVARRYRNFDYPGMIEALRPAAPGLTHLFVVEGPDFDSLDAQLPASSRDPAVEFAARKPAPNDVSVLMYTSGTTGEPKGVLHTHNTLIGSVVKFAERIELNGADIVLMASPLAHLTGFAYGMTMPIVLGGRSVLMDIWDPAKAARVIQDEAVTFTMGATPFVSDLANTPALDTCDISSLRKFLTAGAPITRVLVEHATERLGATIFAAWGMTENGGVTMTKPGDPPEWIFGSDGGPIEGMEMRVVDADGIPVAAGIEGRLQTRGMANFVGYLKRPERFDTDAEGWFETGDLAWMLDNGYIRISGRGKDVIIRGGENIPIVEVEELLYRHRAVEDAAIVAMPDERLGERGCAFVTLKPGENLTFADMVAHLNAAGMSKSYLPERLEIIDAMPRTPSGKIQKFHLREAAAGFSPE